MITMQLHLNIDAQRFIQQVKIQNQQLEEQVQAGLDAAIAELSKEGAIETMIKEAVKKNIMDSFSRWIFQTDIRKKVETQLTEKLSAKIESYTDMIVSEVATKLNL